jgi:hypothetical protein
MTTSIPHKTLIFEEAIFSQKVRAYTSFWWCVNSAQLGAFLTPPPPSPAWRALQNNTNSSQALS